MRDSHGQDTLDHEWEMPEGAINKLKEMLKEDGVGDSIERGQVNGKGRGLYVVKPVPISNGMGFFAMTSSCTGCLLI